MQSKELSRLPGLLPTYPVPVFYSGQAPQIGRQKIEAQTRTHCKRP
jgi:hypothetical protein